MRLRLSAILLVCCLGGYLPSFAQQDAQFSQYMFNTLYFNPAYAGVEGRTKFQLLHRWQWTTYQTSFPNDQGGAPVTSNFTLNSPILRLRSGVGLHITNDNLGPLTNLDAQVSYAYHFPVKRGKLSLGLRGGMFSQTLDFERYRAVEDDDPILRDRTGKESQLRPDLALGIFYRAEKFYGGLSVNHIIRSEFDFGSEALKNPLENHIYLTGGYDYDLTYQIVLSPSFLVKSDFNTYSFEVSTLATYEQKFWGGVSFRQGESIGAIVGAAFGKENAFRLGYAFDYVIKAQPVKRPTSNEVMLSYTLPTPVPSTKSVTRTPRFRY
jgi:type IX secretion system PorP/SprF family membrane protein